MKGVVAISRPADAPFGGAAQRCFPCLPSGGIRPPPSEGLRAVKSPSFTARFSLTGNRVVALHEGAARAMVIESLLP